MSSSWALSISNKQSDGGSGCRCRELALHLMTYVDILLNLPQHASSVDLLLADESSVGGWHLSWYSWTVSVDGKGQGDLQSLKTFWETRYWPQNDVIPKWCPYEVTSLRNIGLPRSVQCKLNLFWIGFTFEPIRIPWKYSDLNISTLKYVTSHIAFEISLL